MARSGISEIESGERKIDLEDLQRIIDALEIHPRRLIPEWFEHTGEEAELLAAYWRLSPSMRSFMLRTMKSAGDTEQQGMNMAEAAQNLFSPVQKPRDE